MSDPHPAPPPGDLPQAPPLPPPGPAPPYYCPPSRSTNGFAVATLVLGITAPCTSPLLAVILGIVALRQIKRRDEQGRRLAIGGLVATGLWLVVGGVAITVAITAYAAGQADRDDSGQITGAGRLSTEDLRPGDCIESSTQAASSATFPRCRAASRTR